MRQRGRDDHGSDQKQYRLFYFSIQVISLPGIYCIMIFSRLTVFVKRKLSICRIVPISLFDAFFGIKWVAASSFRFIFS